LEKEKALYKEVVEKV